MFDHAGFQEVGRSTRALKEACFRTGDGHPGYARLTLLYTRFTQSRIEYGGKCHASNNGP
jgi:hypothetical protein